MGHSLFFLPDTTWLVWDCYGLDRGRGGCLTVSWWVHGFTPGFRVVVTSLLGARRRFGIIVKRYETLFRGGLRSCKTS